MARSTWAVFWAIVGFMFCVSFFRPFPGQGQLPVNIAIVAGLSNAIPWALVLLPLFLVGAWVRRRVRRNL